MEKIKAHSRIVVAASEIGSAPNRVLIFREGTNRALWDDGETLDVKLDSVAAASVMQAFAKLKRNIVFDYEHQSVRSDKHPEGKAPAAGWITSFDYEPGVGLFANVEWTDVAKKEIASQQYRYFSPVFFVDDESGRVTEILNVALTNNPALIDLKPLAASKFLQALESSIASSKAGSGTTDPKEDATMSDEQIAILKAVDKTLGGEPAKDDDSLVASIQSKLDPFIDARRTIINIASAVGCDKDADGDKVLDAVVAAKDAEPNVDPTKWVAMKDHKTEVDGLKSRLDALETEQNTAKRASFLKEGQDAGKITANNRAQWEALYDADADKAGKLLENAEVFVSTRRISDKDGDKPPTDRKAIIAKARKSWGEQSPMTQGVSQPHEWINDYLRDASFSKLTEDERKELGV